MLRTPGTQLLLSPHSVTGNQNITGMLMKEMIAYGFSLIASAMENV